VKSAQQQVLEQGEPVEVVQVAALAVEVKHTLP